jgi:hypothetical protein
MPVVEPLDEEWARLREALHEAWVEATAAANWMMTELYARDVRREGDGAMPRMARVYLYPEARRRFPELASQTVVSIENGVQAAYRAARYKVVWTCAATLHSYRYPMPIPVHNQSWEARIIQERPVVRVRLGNRWWELRLKGGPRFRMQTMGYRQIVSGEAVRGELTLYRVREHAGKVSGRPNRAQSLKYGVMCKMVAWFPREKNEGSGKPASVLRVRTMDEMLLAALGPKQEPIWRYHGDHLRRWAAVHRRSLEHLADDQKAKQQPVPSFADRRSAATRKYRNRMHSAVAEIAAQLTGYAARRGFSTISYDDSDRSFCPDFQYAELRGRIRNKCDAVGLAFRHLNESADSLDDETEQGRESPSEISGPPIGPARSTPGTLADLAARGRL